jgi:hypothetical protein
MLYHKLSWKSDTKFFTAEGSKVCHYIMPLLHVPGIELTEVYLAFVL